MKILKMMMIGVAVIVLLALITVGVFVATFDANAYKQELSALVKQQTGRELVFDGDIGLTLYPSIGMSLGSMSFANAAGFGDAPMLTVQSASISVDLLSILSMSPEVAQLRLDGLKLNLHKKSDGKTNFDDLLAASSSKDAKPGADEAAPSAKPEQLLAISGRFGGLNITRAELVWRDDSTGDEYRLHDLHVLSGAIELQQPFALQMRMKVDNREALRAELQLSSEVLIKQSSVELSSFSLTTMAGGTMLPVERAEIKAMGALGFALATQQLSIRGFSVALQTRGGLSQQGKLSLAGEVGFDVAKQQLNMAAVDLQADLVGPGMPNGQIRAGLSAGVLGVDLSSHSLRLDDLQLSVGEDRFRGYLRANDYLRPDVEFVLTSERLDVDKLLGLDKKAEPAPAVEQSEPAKDVQIALPMEPLRALKLKGQVKIASLKVSQLSFSDVNIAINAQQGVIDIKPIDMRLYQGTLAGDMRIDVAKDAPRYTLNQSLSKFKIGLFLQDFMDDDRISGEANLDIKLSSKGEWLSQLKRALDGAIKVDIRDGALKGFNLRHKIATAKAKLGGDEPPPETERKTDFSALALSGQVKQGVFSSDDLNIEAPLMRVKGAGSADLVDETVNYQVKAKLVGTTKGQTGGSADELSGIPIPVAITGPWLAPKIDVQYDEMLKARLNAEKAQLREQVEREKAALSEKLNAEKAKLRALQERETEARKLELESKRNLAVDEEKARLEARKKEEQERAKDKLKDKLKNLF